MKYTANQNEYVIIHNIDEDYVDALFFIEVKEGQQIEYNYPFLEVFDELQPCIERIEELGYNPTEYGAVIQ